MENLMIAGYSINTTALLGVLGFVLGFACIWIGFAAGQRKAKKLLAAGQKIFDKLQEVFLADDDFRILSNEAEPVHHYFNLTYAQYLAIPRSILQNMPTDWQRVFVGLLYKLDTRFDWRRPGCWVRFQDSNGRYMKDELADYERGRRVLTPDEVHEISERAKAKYGA